MKRCMNCYSKISINIVTLIFAVIVFIQTNLLMIKLLSINFPKEGESYYSSKIQTKEEKLEEKEEKWKIIIPRISLTAQIQEGTQQEIIDQAIGHFTQTPTWEGNIGLVAGAKGYTKNYFQQLDQLEEGDVILYQKGDQQREYVVIQNIVIEQTDWSYLDSTQENQLTLITGVEETQKRRCVQAIEIK